MINKFLALPLILAASVAAHPVRNEPVRRQLPSLSQWPSTNESWWSFKVRYQSLSCDGQQGSDFFNTCCNPLPAGQTTANLPAQCQPATLTCVSPAPSTLTVTTSSAAPAPSDNTQSNNDGSNDGEEDCDDSDDDDSDDSYTPSTDNSGQTTDNSGGNTWTDNSGDNSGQTDNSGDNSGYTDNSWNNNNNGGSTTTTDNSGSTDNSGNNNNNGGSSSSTSGDVTGGFATYFYQNGVAGACGTVHSDYDLIGAIDVAWYGDMGQQSQYCGRSVTITNLNNGQQVTITIADVCPTCDTSNSIDLSVGAFQAISDLGAGEVPISWHFN